MRNQLRRCRHHQKLDAKDVRSAGTPEKHHQRNERHCVVPGVSFMHVYILGAGRRLRSRVYFAKFHRVFPQLFFISMFSRVALLTTGIASARDSCGEQSSCVQVDSYTEEVTVNCYDPNVDQCIDTRAGGQVCPLGSAGCFQYGCGGSGEYYCFNPNTHQCVSSETCQYTVCALDEVICGGECKRMADGECCGQVGVANSVWMITSENRQCCIGRCSRRCETWTCDATAEGCGSSENSFTCAPRSVV